MIKAGYRILVLLLALGCMACRTDDAAEPSLNAEQTRSLVMGKWKVERVNYQVCRNGNCTATNYAGTDEDLFEFRADSAFLYRHAAASTIAQPEAFKVDYKLPGALVLMYSFWSATCQVKENEKGDVVLVCSYAGADPYAVFKDTYYLYR